MNFPYMQLEIALVTRLSCFLLRTRLTTTSHDLPSLLHQADFVFVVRVRCSVRINRTVVLPSPRRMTHTHEPHCAIPSSAHESRPRVTIFHPFFIRSVLRSCLDMGLLYPQPAGRVKSTLSSPNRPLHCGQHTSLHL